ncbi:signal recognition particle-docking protein FtsY [Candidatus Woesearchaeota archaeon]|nr:signal recognition particle-docking protein FtsY [Candidatus Woesearchaeota archaeon]
MFKFLKEKLKKSIAAFSKKIDKEGEEEVKEEIKEESEEVKEAPKEEPKKEGFFKRIFKKSEITEDDEKLVEKDEKKKEGLLAKEKAEEEKKAEQEKKEAEQKAIEAERKAEEERIIVEKAEQEKKAAEKQTEEAERKAAEAKKTAEEAKKAEEKAKKIAEEERDSEEKAEAEKQVEEARLAKEQAEEEKKEAERKAEEAKRAAEKAKESERLASEKAEKERREAEESQKAAEEEAKKEEERAAEKARQETKEAEPKKGFFAKIKEKVITKKISENKFNEMFWDLEVALLENNVAVQVIEKIKEDLKKDIVDTPIRRNKIEQTIILSLTDSIKNILTFDKIDLIKKSEEKKPYVIAFVGINGSGKTTTIAKMTQMFLDADKKVVLAAADTFRAAAIDQLQIHADKLGVKMIKHDYGSDPAAVAFDAIKYAKSKDTDVVLIDTAGRLHSNINLVDEMKKIIRVADPDMKIFVGESITGNDCVEQAERFNEAIEIDGIILAKADIDEKGGAALSISYVTQKPILYLGTGQEYSDIKPFDKDEIMKSLGLEA